MDRRLLSPDEIREAASGLPGWETADAELRRTLTFADFSAAFAFMTRVAMIAEQLDHHPNWSNVYNTVEIAVTTHDSGGLTALDLEFAQRVSALLDATA